MPCDSPAALFSLSAPGPPIPNSPPPGQNATSTAMRRAIFKAGLVAERIAHGSIWGPLTLPSPKKLLIPRAHITADPIPITSPTTQSTRKIIARPKAFRRLTQSGRIIPTIITSNAAASIMFRAPFRLRPAHALHTRHHVFLSIESRVVRPSCQSFSLSRPFRASTVPGADAPG